MEKEEAESYLHKKVENGELISPVLPEGIKNYLIDIYRKYNSKKKKMLLKLLSSTESVLRKESGLSLVVGLRFLLNIKKITIS